MAAGSVPVLLLLLIVTLMLCLSAADAKKAIFNRSNKREWSWCWDCVLCKLYVSIC